MESLRRACWLLGPCLLAVLGCGAPPPREDTTLREFAERSVRELPFLEGSNQQPEELKWRSYHVLNEPTVPSGAGPDALADGFVIPIFDGKMAGKPMELNLGVAREGPDRMRLQYVRFSDPTFVPTAELLSDATRLAERRTTELTSRSAARIQLTGWILFANYTDLNGPPDQACEFLFELPADQRDSDVTGLMISARRRPGKAWRIDAGAQVTTQTRRSVVTVPGFVPAGSTP